MNQYREMRMMVVFDLPVKTKREIREANQFRNNLKKEGFIMVQYSIYSRFCRNSTEYYKYVRRIKGISPKGKGEVRIFGLTEKQYNKMILISSKKKSDEELLSISPLVVID